VEDIIENSTKADILFSLAVIAAPALLSSMKDLKKINFASFFCTVAVFYMAFVIFACGAIALAFRDAVVLPKGVARGTKLVAVNNDFSKVFKAVFKYIFALSCQQNMVRVFSLMKKRTVKSGTKVAAIAVAVGSFAYFLVANGGYIAAGNGQPESILDELENPGKAFAHIAEQKVGRIVGRGIEVAKLEMVLVLFVGYPLQMHPTRDSILTFLSINSRAKSFISRNRRVSEVSVTSLMSGLVFLGSFMKMKYEKVTDFIAVTASYYIMYTLPSLAYILSSKKKRYNVAISVGVIIFSLFVSFYGLYTISAK